MRTKYRILKTIRVCIVIVCIFTLAGCRRSHVLSEEEKKPAGEKIKIQYARGFKIRDYGSYKVIQVSNPWQNFEGENLTYLLYNRDTDIPEINKSAIAIEIPVSKVICMSTTHVAMISELGRIESLVGISGKQYITQPDVRKKIKNGEISDIGYEQNLNYEQILALHPDVIFMYGVTGEVTPVLNKLLSLRIPVVLNAEYLEREPLAKAEWIKFMACFYNELEIASKLFGEIEILYNDLKTVTQNSSYKPLILSGLPWKNTWWVPGGRSYAAALIRDAGGRYIWEDDTSREAIPLDIEAVYDRAGKADIWINAGSAESLSNISGMDTRLQYFKSFTDNKVYNNNARVNPSGGNDYWESGVMNPHIILSDLISIFHPEALPGYKLVYYKKLE